jgi:hypothetical protein
MKTLFATRTARIIVLALIYFIVGKFGLALAFVNPSATALASDRHCQSRGLVELDAADPTGGLVS